MSRQNMSAQTLRQLLKKLHRSQYFQNVYGLNTFVYEPQNAVSFL